VCIVFNANSASRVPYFTSLSTICLLHHHHLLPQCLGWEVLLLLLLLLPAGEALDPLYQSLQS